MTTVDVVFHPKGREEKPLPAQRFPLRQGRLNMLTLEKTFDVKVVQRWLVAQNRTVVLDFGTYDPTLLDISAEELKEGDGMIHVTGDPLQEEKIESVLFATAELGDVLDISELTESNDSWMVSVDELPEDGPSDWLLQSLRIFYPIWTLSSENARRTIIDLFLADVLKRDEMEGLLRVDLEVNMEHTGGRKKRRRLAGRIDYLIGHAGGKRITDYKPPKDSHLVVVEAKLEWPAQSRNQLLAEANDGEIAASKLVTLSWHGGLTSEDIMDVYRWLLYVVRKAKQTSPTASRTTSTRSIEI
ncbi:hypothetical protein HDU86_008339 [Geranomyces michiganensis]|nr:hypothetical protein HDU86_008339 [Geranomyces michiganensis]